MSTTVSVTTDQLVEQIRKEAAAQPDRIGTTTQVPGGPCMYGHIVGGKYEPVCLVGHAFHALGITLRDGNLSTSFLRAWGNNLLVGYQSADDPEDDLEQRNWIERVQKYQDRGFAWAEAVSRADVDVADGKTGRALEWA